MRANRGSVQLSSWQINKVGNAVPVSTSMMESGGSHTQTYMTSVTTLPKHGPVHDINSCCTGSKERRKGSFCFDLYTKDHSLGELFKNMRISICVAIGLISVMTTTWDRWEMHPRKDIPTVPEREASVDRRE